MNHVSFPCPSCGTKVEVEVFVDGVELTSKPCACLMHLSEVDRLGREEYDSRCEEMDRLAALEEIFG